MPKDTTDVILSGDSQDTDAIVLEETAETATALDMKYRQALATPGADFSEIGKKTDEAYAAYTKARLKLLMPGLITVEADILEIRRIRKEIDNAAKIQKVIEGAIKFIGFLAKFF